VLRNLDAFGLAGDFPCLAPLSGDGVTRPKPASRKAPWPQADVERALAAAGQADLKSYRVEVAPDGTIAIVVGAPSETAPSHPARELSRP
jgi:hypothetical protein